MVMPFFRASVAFRASLLAWALIAPAAAEAEDTPSVFQRYRDAVVKIRITETSSGAKAVIGSGFYVRASGLVATNYHVVSQLVQHPERYRAQCETASGEVHDLEILAIDVVHDLAVARAEATGGPVLELAAGAPARGARLWAFGFPHDLGISIVEGTHNGRLEHSLFEKIHFTASINAGMSGGPALESGGRVVGINVATAGNQVSFLVPAASLVRLVARVEAADFAPATDLRDEVREQLLASQDTYVAELLRSDLPTIEFGEFRVPSELTAFFNCWADAADIRREPYEQVTHRCSTEDYVFLSNGHWAGVVSLRHERVSSDELGPIRFAELYSSSFATSWEWGSGGEDDVTRYRCTTEAVEHGALRFKLVFCLRAYKDLPGLYDAVQKSAVLGVEGRGLVSTLVLSGVSYENARALGRRLLEGISWAP